MKTDLAIDSEATAKKLIEFIKHSVSDAGFSHVVIGLSGGIDSATSCALAVRALGKEHVYPVFLPMGDLDREGREDAKTVVDTLGIPEIQQSVWDIAPFVEQIITRDTTMDDIRKGNVMARTRMIILFDQAKKLQALVLGTENKTEHLLGYFTRFGDEASDIEPIRTLYKTQVRQLAVFLGIPEKILTKAPTAGLWQGQTDEGEFGFSYEDADQILELFCEKKLSMEEIHTSGFQEDMVKKVLTRMKENKFKHALPCIITL